MATLEVRRYALPGGEVVTLTVAHCHQCGHEWVLRQPRLPRLCPRCKTGLWYEPKRLDT